MPPGSAKSTYASLIFPAWWMHRFPGSAIIAASHTADLAAHFGRSLRNLIAEHPEPLGYALAKDSRAAHSFQVGSPVVSGLPSLSPCGMANCGRQNR